jgi:hypothetical protein
MIIPHALRQFARTSNGSVTVEFIATLPLLLMTLAFSFEFGYALWAYDVASRDVSAAVRYYARTNPLDSNAARNVAMTGSPTGTPPKHFPWNLTSTPTITFTTPVANFNAGGLYRQSGEVVQAQGSVPLSLPMLGYLSVLGVPTAYTLVVAGQARHNDIGD